LRLLSSYLIQYINIINITIYILDDLWMLSLEDEVPR
jgi:hypothetical protein